MKLLVTGVEGYIGCLLAPLLQKRGHEVVGLDTATTATGGCSATARWSRAFPVLSIVTSET